MNICSALNALRLKPLGTVEVLQSKVHMLIKSLLVDNPILILLQNRFDPLAVDNIQ